MFNRNLAVAHGFAKGLASAATNIYNIRQAKAEQKAKDEAFQLDKKIADANIKKGEFLYGPEAMEFAREKHKATVSAEKAAYNLNMVKIRNAEQEETRKAEKYATGMKIVDKFLQDEAPPEGLQYDFSGMDIPLKRKGDVSATQQRKEELQKGEALEVLKRGWGSDDKGDFEFQDRDEAKDYIMDKYDIDMNDPELGSALGQYKEREEKIAPASGGFLGMGKRNYPTKEKYGFTYEKREDGKWHRKD